MPQGSANEVLLPKQRFNIYTTMLLLSFLFITTGCVILWLEFASHMRDPATGQFSSQWPWVTSDANVVIPPPPAPTIAPVPEAPVTPMPMPMTPPA